MKANTKTIKKKILLKVSKISKKIINKTLRFLPKTNFAISFLISEIILANLEIENIILKEITIQFLQF